MASCLVPEFPAVTDALEHLRELDNELREDGIAFSVEASFHLSEITAAITELEGYRLVAQESLEAESSENGKISRHISNTKEEIRREILADLAAVRASSAAEIDRLQKHLMEVSQMQDATIKRQNDLMRQTETLYSEKQQVKAEHEVTVADLNDQVSIKNGLQMKLDQSQEQTEVLTCCTVTAERDKVQLQERMELEREAFAVRREHVYGEVERMEEETKKQKQVVRRRRKELGRVNEKKQETQEHLSELKFQMAVLESSLQRVTESRSQCEKQLEGETKKYQHLKEKKELLKKDLQESKVTSSTLIQHLSEEINTMESEIAEAQASRVLHQDSLAQIFQTLKQQHDMESQARADGFRVVQKLQKSKLQLNDRVACIVKHRKEIREMDEQITTLWQASTVNKCMFERDLQEISNNMETQRRMTIHFEEEKKQFAELIDTIRSRQEEHVAKLTSDIKSTKRRYQELLQEETALQQPLSMNADLLIRHVKHCRAKYSEEEARCRQEIEECTADVDVICQNNKEKERQVEKEEKRLKEVEAMWTEEELRHKRINSLVDELKKRETNLELMLLELNEKTCSLLQPRNELKAQLEDVQKCYMEMLENQISELRDAEMSIYDCFVKVEQVRLENSRFHLCIKQMTEDVCRAEEDGDRYQEETRLIRQEARDVLDSLQECWKQDVSVTLDHQCRDGDLLTAMNITRKNLKTKREEFENLSTCFQQQVLQISSHLGDRAIPGQQCLSAGLLGTKVLY